MVCKCINAGNVLTPPPPSPQYNMDQRRILGGKWKRENIEKQEIIGKRGTWRETAKSKNKNALIVTICPFPV